MPLTVLHVVPAFAPTRGGIEVLVESLSEELKNQHDINSVVMAPRSFSERPDDYSVGSTRVLSVDFHVPQSQVATLGAFAQVFTTIRRHILNSQADVLHIHGCSPLTNTSVAIAKQLKLPYVMHVHGGLDADFAPDYLAIVRDAPSVLAVSHFVRDSIYKITKRERPIEVIRNGIRPNNTTLPCTEKSGVCMVGRLEPSKGFGQALKALVPIITDYPSLKVDIIGRGQLHQELTDLTVDLGINANVNFLGMLSHERTLEIIGNSQVVVVPSLSIEGFSLVAAEAAQLSIPVVASRIAGLPETVIDGVTGTLVDPWNIQSFSSAIQQYLGDSELAASHGRAAQHRAVHEFSLERMARQICNTYNSHDLLRTR